MNHKGRTFGALFLLLCSQLALANLPDELNFKPYKLEYEKLSSQVDSISQKLHDAKAELENTYSLEADLIRSIKDLKNLNHKLESSISASKNELLKVKSIIRNLETSINNKQNKKRDLLSREQRVKQKLESEKRRLAPLRQKLVALKKKMKIKERELVVAKKKLAQAKSALVKIESEITALESNTQRLGSSLTKQKKQLATIDNQINQVKKKISSLPAQISSAKQKVATAQKSLAQSQNQLKEKQKEIAAVLRENRRDPRLRTLRTELAGLAGKVKTSSKRVELLKGQLKKIQNSKKGLEQQVVQLNRQKAKLPGLIKNTEAAIRKNKVTIKNKRGKKDQLKTQQGLKVKELEQVKSEFSGIQSKTQKVESQLAIESSKAKGLKQKLSLLEKELKQVSKSLASDKDLKAHKKSQATQIAQLIPKKERELRLNRAEVVKLDNNLKNTQRSIGPKEAIVSKLSNRENAAIVKRDSKYNEYRVRFDFYNTKLSEARNIGSDQVGNVHGVAVSDSDKAVLAKANSLGFKMAEKQAASQANFWGSARGEIAGFKAGYELGRASVESREDGASQGSLAGTQAAKDYGNLTLKPKFFDQFFKEALNTTQVIPTFQTELLQMKSHLLLEEEGSLDQVEVFSQKVEPLSDAELRESQAIITKVDEAINTFHIDNINVRSQVREMSLAQNVYKAPTSIPFGKPVCTSVYKAIAEFKTACAGSYKSTFSSKYLSSFKSNFSAQYTGLYTNALDSRRDSLIEGLFESAFNKYFEVAKVDGVNLGKQDIFDEVFAESRELAYNNALPAVTQESRINAKVEVENWIANNATLKLTSSAILSGSLRGGTEARIRLVVKNISQKDLTQPVRVVITEGTNAIFQSKVFFLKEAKGLSSTNFDDISFRVSTNSRAGQVLKVKGYLELSGGKYTKTRLVDFSVNAITAINPAMSSRLNFDATPKVVTGFGRRTLIHNLDINVSPSVESVPSGYLVSAKAAPGFEGMIQLKNISVTTGRIDLGFFQKARFSYTFPRSSEDKLVKLQLTYSHLGEVVKTETIDLRPH